MPSERALVPFRLRGSSVRRIAFLPVLAVLAAFSLPASAQVSDNSDLYNRIDRLERELQTLQAQAARGGVPSTTVVNSPALGGGTSTSYGSAGPSNPPGNLAVQLTDRVDQLEDQVQQITGKVEEATHKANEVAAQLQRLQADIDLRFKELQGGATPAPGSTQPPAPGVSMPGPAGAGVNVGGNASDANGAAPGPQVLGTMSARDLKKAEQAAPAAPAPAATQFKDPQAMYDDAYAKIQGNDYDGAEAEFKAFLTKFPSHQLASNAQFWIADIAFMRKDFKQSATLFLEAYKKYPHNSKAPDMLYKAGASFARLDPPRKSEACTAFKLLFEEQPSMPEHVRRAATADKKTLGCP
jgi:tol-pal system protein YbgF